jgi:hypothetical protein
MSPKSVLDSVPMDYNYYDVPMSAKPDDQYSDEEATRRMNEALRRALTSPPKPHSEMKLGKRKAKRVKNPAPKSKSMKSA